MTISTPGLKWPTHGEKVQLVTDSTPGLQWCTHGKEVQLVTCLTTVRYNIPCCLPRHETHQRVPFQGTRSSKTPQSGSISVERRVIIHNHACGDQTRLPLSEPRATSVVTSLAKAQQNARMVALTLFRTIMQGTRSVCKRMVGLQRSPIHFRVCWKKGTVDMLNIAR